MSSQHTQNKLAEKPTPWPVWFAVIPMIGFMLLSFLNILMQQFENPLFMKVNPLLQLIILALFTLGVVRLASGRRISASDMGFDTKALTKRNVIIILVVFAVTHLAFYFIGKTGTVSSNLHDEFIATGFGQGFLSDLIVITGVVLVAPVVEELVYRGVMLRAIHDGFLRAFPKQRSMFGLPAVIAVSVTALAFIMPHVSQFNLLILAYFLTSAGFSVVYLMTRSMVAAIVSHSLQSAVAFSTLLLQGHGEVAVSPVIYAIAFCCPVLVYFIGSAIGRIWFRR